MTDIETTQTPVEASAKAADDFVVNETDVPWFLWVFFGLIICWASVSWLPLFGY